MPLREMKEPVPQGIATHFPLFFHRAKADRAMFSVILRAKFRAITRVLREEWATYFLLGPIMIGVALLLGRKIFYDFAVDIGRIKAISIPEDLLVRLGFATLFLKVFFNFLPLAKRLYPTEQNLKVEDLLPINFNIRYQVFYLEQLLRDLPFFILGTVLVLFFARPDLIGWPLTIWLFFPGVEIGFTLAWIHIRSPDRVELGLAFLVLLFLLMIVPIAQFAWWADAMTFFFVPLGYYRGFKSWRYRDSGRVERFLIEHQSRKRHPLGDAFLQGLCRMVPKTVRPLVRRDLLLSVRNFVPPFWRNSVLSFMIALGVLGRGTVNPVVFCGLAAFVMASTVSPLFALQRPYRQVETALPLSVEQIWRSKLNYARLLALPMPWVVWMVEIVARPLPLQDSLSLLFTLLLVGFAVASLVGGSICEGDQRPALQYIIAAMLSALATLFIALFNPLLFILLFPILSSLKDSAVTRLEGEGVVS